MRALRVFIVEDEEIQRRQMHAWLATAESVKVVGDAPDGESAIRLINESAPDVVLLDVSLPECSGLDVLARITHGCDVIFTTAFRDHAIAAFELGAVDYLLKPFGRDRLMAALSRVSERDDSRGNVALSQRVALVRDTEKPLERLFVRDRSAIVPIPIAAIVRLEADGDYTAVVTAERRFLVAVSISALVDRFRSADFVRVHRQHAVNLAHVARLVPFDAGRLTVEFRRGGSVLASRAGSQLLRGLVE